ncbi:MAG: POTRA domain-containing protein, partial [Desulfatiglandales bacterium]
MVIFLVFVVYNPLIWAKEHLIYRTVISGDISKSIKKEISENIESLRLEDKEIVTSESILKALMAEDKTTIEKIMRSYGYYSPKISLEIKKTEEGYIAEFGVER